VRADPAADALAQLNEVSRQAEQITEAMHAAQLTLNEKIAAQQAAEQKHADNQRALDEAMSQLGNYQAAVDKLAAATYMGGRTDGLNSILTANSPQQLIDDISMQRAMGTEMAATMDRFRKARQLAADGEEASARSTADARIAAQQAAAASADVQAKHSQLQVQIAAVKSQYEALTPDQRAALAAPAPAPEVLAAAPDAMSPIPGEAPGDIAPPEAVPAAAPGGPSALVVQAALTRVGSPYSWGAAGPNAFDCSGLIMWAFQQAGISLPHSSQALAKGGQPVAFSELQPGDIVTFYSDVSHAGIYIGDGMMVHASTYGTPVRVAPVTSSPFYNARRY
jgi:cell wall-associated NlpC family hydrolase